MPPTGNIQLGRLGRLFAAVEASFANGGAFTAITAANALRHLEVDFPFDPYKLTDAPDRHRTPDLERTVSHQATAGFDIKKLAMWPSGVLGTAPEADPILLNGLGATRIPAVTTTVASAPAVGGATLTDASELLPQDLIAITVSGDKRRVVSLLTVNTGTGAVTWAPNLPVAPTDGDAVKTGVQYALTTELPATLYLAHFLLQNAVYFSREVLGCVVDTLSFTVEQAQEPLMSATGPAQYVNRPPGQAEPGGFTTIGSALPTGMLASLFVGNTQYPIKKIVSTMKNNSVVRMGEIGHDRATDYYRQKQRMITLAIDAFVENPTPLYALGESKTTAPVLVQCGTVEGQTWAWYYPTVLPEVPTTPDGDTELVWSFKARALGLNGNDEFVMAQL